MSACGRVVARHGVHSLGRKDATEVETTPDGRLPDAKQAEEHL